MSAAPASVEDGRSQIVGVLGGMGPDATAEFYRRLIALTPARRDQEHLHVIIDADPGVPDRTAALLGDGESPLPRMRAAVERLVAAGVDLIAVPCNTAHVWLRGLQEGVPIPIIDMVEETACAAASKLPAASPVGLLATTGTLYSGLYDGALASHGLRVVHPDDAGQRRVMDGISRVKSGDQSIAKSILIETAQRLVDRGVRALVLGCTEIPLVLGAGDVAVSVFDSLDVLARRVLALVRSPDVGPAEGGR